MRILANISILVVIATLLCGICSAGEQNPNPDEWLWIWSDDKVGIFVANQPSWRDKKTNAVEQNLLRVSADGSYDKSVIQITSWDNVVYSRRINVYYYDSNKKFVDFEKSQKWVVTAPGTVGASIVIKVTEQLPKELRANYKK
jgi:hypothetical protein